MPSLIDQFSNMPFQPVMRVEHDGQILWIKQRPHSKQTMWHRLQSLLSTCLPPIFKMTASAGGPKSLQDEANRFKIFAAQNIPVPTVIGLNDTMIILNDVGAQLKSRIDMSPDPQRLVFLHQATQALAKLHLAGLCHGRPLLRDMTIQDNVVYFIDLEEDPTAHMSLAQAQARDAWLFFNGAARYTKQQPAWLDELFVTYAHTAPAPVLVELKKMVAQLKPLAHIARYVIVPFASKDVWQAVQANRALARALNV